MIIAKTQRNMEYIAKHAVHEELGDVKVEVRPRGFLGLLIVHSNEIEKLRKIPEIETLIPIVVRCKAELGEITSKASELIEYAGNFDTFAVRTTRRGKHNFTSLDVNISLGSKIKELTGADVDLDFPDKSFYVEIIGEKAYLGVIDGSEERKKYTPEKKDSRKLLNRISIVQLPYLGSLNAARSMGERIGRAAQSFEVKELIIAPFDYVEITELEAFLGGVRVGKKSRLEIQKRTYSRKVREVKIYLHDLYQVVRDKKKKGNILIATDPTGKQISDIENKLKSELHQAKEIVIFIGSRQGIPKGIFRLCDYVIDLSPYITFATEQAIPAVLIALISVFQKPL